MTTVTDILPELTTDEQVIAYIKADKASLMEQISAGFAHETKNPIGLIMLSADVLSDSWSLQVDDNNRREELLSGGVSSIQQSAAKLMMLISAMNDFMQPLGAKINSQINLNEILERSLLLTAFNARRLVGRVETSFQNYLPQIVADVSSLYHIVISLILKVIELGIVSDSVLTVSTEINGDMVELNIRLKGIDPSYSSGCMLDQSEKNTSWWTLFTLAKRLQAEIGPVEQSDNQVALKVGFLKSQEVYSG